MLWSKSFIYIHIYKQFPFRLQLKMTVKRQNEWDYLGYVLILIQSCRIKEVLVRVQTKVVDCGVEKEENVVSTHEISHGF